DLEAGFTILYQPSFAEIGKYSRVGNRVNSKVEAAKTHHRDDDDDRCSTADEMRCGMSDVQQAGADA
ncbi:hypothetical protein ABTL06_19685, partial [Acinetobacter baumannii]